MRKRKGAKEGIAQSRNKTTSKREGSGKHHMDTSHPLQTEQAGGFGFFVCWFLFFAFFASPNTIPVGLYIQSVQCAHTQRRWVQNHQALQHSECGYPEVFECEFTGSPGFRWSPAFPLTSKSPKEKEKWGIENLQKGKRVTRERNTRLAGKMFIEAASDQFKD